MTKQTAILFIVFAVLFAAWFFGVLFWVVLIGFVLFLYSWWLHNRTWQSFEAEQNRRALMRAASPPAAPVEAPAPIAGPRHWVFPKSRRRRSFKPQKKKSLFDKTLNGKPHT